MQENRDPFDFFREHLPESQKRRISLEEERRDKRSRTEYPIFTFAPLIVGILDVIYSLLLFLGIYSGMQGAIVSVGRVLEQYSGIVLVVNALALSLGLFALFVSNKKKFPLVAILVCFLVSLPLAAMYLIYISPPAIKQKEAITIVYKNIPASVAGRAPLTVRWNRQSGTWEMEFYNVNITPEELGWTNDPSGSPSVTLNLIGDSGLPESKFKTLLVNIDGKTGEVVSKVATAAPYQAVTPPVTVISPKPR